MLSAHWPRWIFIPIGFALTVLIILVGLVLEPAALALAPQPEPVPAPTRLPYAVHLSDACIACHTNQEPLRQSIASGGKLWRMFIDPADILSGHGRLGCVTCHRGTGGTEDVDVAHTGLVVDPTLGFTEACLLCHRDLPNEFSQTLLRAPHDQVVHGLAANLTCSDCHGAVGHGFDAISGEVICSMTGCLDCHKERNLDTQLEDCEACHLSHHDVALLALTCSDCHVSTDTWKETRLAVHPVELDGWHAETGCFDCHDWPNFGGLNYVCSDCHYRYHYFGTNECETCHAPSEGWNTDSSAEDAETHPFPRDHDRFAEYCNLCHPGGNTTAYSCSICHP